MTTSGTVAQTLFLVADVVDHSYRRVKIPAQLITGEKLRTATQLLWTMLQSWANQGHPVWKIETQRYGLYQGVAQVPADSGTIEFINQNLVTPQRLTGTYVSSAGGDPSLAFDTDLTTAFTQVAPNGQLDVDLGAENLVECIGLLANASQTGTLTVSASDDAVTYYDALVLTAQPFVDRRWIWKPFVAPLLDAYRYLRFTASGGLTLNFREIVIGNLLSAIELEPINKDDYFSLPNKAMQSRPVEFWEDKQRDVPVLTLWPTPDFASNFRYIEAQVHQRIQDVGSLTNTLDIPDRFYEAVVWGLAALLAWEDEDYKGDPSIIEAKAAREVALAFAGLTDGGPVRMMPNIRHYTR